MTADALSFRNAMSLFPTGITVVTTLNSQGHPYGVTVNSFTSVSLNPLLVLICLDNQLSGLDQFKNAGQFAINILSKDQIDLCRFFSTPGTDRTQSHFFQGDTRLPLIKGALAMIECKLEQTYLAGDHTILLGEVLATTVGNRQKQPLIFFRGRYGDLIRLDGPKPEANKT